MKVLVTGAAGFVGARLASVLLEGGHSVMGLDVLDGQDPPGWQDARLKPLLEQSRFAFERTDVIDAEAVQNLFARVRPQAVIHLASRRDLDLAEANPADCFALHLGGAQNVMRACRRTGVGHLVLGSSAHVYGSSRRYPLVETDPADRPLSMVGAAFRAAELAAHVFSLRNSCNVTVVRLFSCYGPWQAPDRFLPRLFDAARRRVALPVFGDGTAARDLIFVDDAVIGMLRVLDRPAPFRVLNLGSQESVTLEQVAETVTAFADVVFQTRHLPLRPGEMPQTWADISRIRDETGFEPQVGLIDGIRRTFEWYNALPDELRP